MDERLERLLASSAAAQDRLKGWTRSANRMVFRLGDIEFRQFAADDAQALFAVRNHPSVRRFMPNPGELDFAAHVAWTRKYLCGGSILLFVAWSGVRPAGFTLLKAVADPGSLELGVMFIDELQQTLVPALAAAYTGCLALDVFGVERLVTYASSAHARALKLNRGLGLEPAPSDKPGELAFCTSRESLLAGRAYRRHAAALQRGLGVVSLPGDGRVA